VDMRKDDGVCCFLMHLCVRVSGARLVLHLQRRSRPMSLVPKP
jgi:hypothetical protein